MGADASPLLMHVFPRFNVGGPQVRFATLANQFGRRFRHAIVSMEGPMEARALLDPELDVQFPQVGARKGDTHGNFRRFRAVLRDLAPDLLVTSNWGSIEWALARIGTRVPHLHMEDGFGPEESVHQVPHRVMLRRLLLRQAKVVLPSRLLWRIATETWCLPRSNVRLLPNGVDLARFAAAGPRKAGQPIVIGIVAALRPEKNIARLIRAMGRLPAAMQARLVIVGDGPERAALQSLATSIGIQVEFAGHHADPAPFYASFDIFALSSDTEQMPLSVLEAMASGLPVASTDVGDVATMLDASNRPYVVAKDDGALAEALTSLAVRSDLRATLGAANRTRAEAEFAETQMIAAWRDLFAGLALDRRR